MLLCNSTNSGIRQRRAQPIHRASTKPADLPLHAALFVTARYPWPVKEGAEAIVAAQRNKSLSFLTAAALQHSGHRRLQIVVPDPSRNAQLGKGANVSFEKRFLAPGW
jgi:hypothetical protein